MPQTVYWTGIYLFTYSFFCSVSLFLLLSAFPHVSYGCFFMLPAAVAAVLCCSTEAEVSLAVITHCLLHSSIASTGLLVSLFWSRSISAFLSQSVCLNMSQCSMLLFSMSPSPSQNSWGTSMLPFWGLRDTIISFHPGSLLIGALGEENLGISSSLG